MGKKKNTKVAERPKTRKELRKDKRTQKKANRVHFHKRKKELKIEYRERIKQQQKEKKKQGARKKPAAARPDDDDEYDDDDAEQASIGSGDIYDQADMSDDGDDAADDPNVRGPNDSEEEIDSDFTLSDDELEQKFAGRARKGPAQPTGKKQKARPSETDEYVAGLQKEKQKQRQLEREMRKQRVKQLRAANEDEDKTIRRLEKQLKIDKKRSEKHVPTMFNDGLEYALELCLPENIQKMYTAAKEAAAADEEDGEDAGFEEDLALAMGGEAKAKAAKGKRKAEAKAAAPTKKQRKDVEEAQAKSAAKMAKLRQAENKYFDTDDELDSEFDGADNDSEQGDDGASSDDQVLEVHNKHKKKPLNKTKKPAAATDESDLDDDFGLQDDENNFVDDDSDSMDDEEFSDEEEEEQESEPDERPTAKKTPAKKAVAKKPAAKKQAPVDDDDDEEDFDEDVFGLSSGDEQESGDEKPAGKSKPDEWEDIYGRTRDKEGNVIATNTGGAPTKYLPPHLRARLAAEQQSATATDATDASAAAAAALDDDPQRREHLQRLRKQLNGSLNRLAEENLPRCAKDIEAVYGQHSRHDVNDTLAQLVEAALVSPVLARERSVLEHMALVAALHANVGSEVGAFFLQRFVERLAAMLPQCATYAVDDKRLDNVLQVLCHMYTFKLFPHQLIYEIFGRLTAAPLSEKSVECVLLALRSIGFTLRRDEPLALKELIVALQRKAAEAEAGDGGELRANPRVRFMLDVLLAIKNNNVHKMPAHDGGELAERLRRLVREALVRRGQHVATLNVTLDDLLRAETKGKWWVVGSAWSGKLADIGGAAAATAALSDADARKRSARHADATRFSAQIVELARQQRMNTDDRRNVFCILMSAEDYVDAFEKLQQLGLRDHKIVVTVLLHCCLNERSFNPYYAVLAQKLCDYDRKYQLAVQFALWDRIRDVAALGAQQVRNVAQFVVELVRGGGLALSVLKVVEFGELDARTMRLVRQVVLALLMGEEAVCRQVFGRLAPSAKLRGFKDSMRLFLNHFLLKGAAGRADVPAKRMELLRRRIQIADRALETVDSRVQF